MHEARRTWYTAVRATSLPLTESEKYTITYDAYLPSAGENYKEWTFIGFGFSKSVSTSAGNTLTFWKSQNTDLATNTLLISKNNTNPYSSGNILSNTVSNTVDFSGKHSFVLSIDGKSVTMYMDGVLCGTLTLKDGNNYNEDGKLALGMRIHADLLNVEGDVVHFTI